jgi:hypothetical protein
VDEGVAVSAEEGAFGQTPDDLPCPGLLGGGSVRCPPLLLAYLGDYVACFVGDGRQGLAEGMVCPVVLVAVAPAEQTE